MGTEAQQFIDDRSNKLSTDMWPERDALLLPSKVYFVRLQNSRKPGKPAGSFAAQQILRNIPPARRYSE